MRRAAWIFFASIFLPSLGLAWLAVHSVRDQQVVLEHQQAIISQNVTDALAKSVQDQMDAVRGDFVKTTEQLLTENASPQLLAQNFNRRLRDAWPLAAIGFAVNLNGVIYSPTPYDGPEARTFRDENDRFLSNRENVEVYSSNSINLKQNGGMVLNAGMVQNTGSQYGMKLADVVANAASDKFKKESQVVTDLPPPVMEAGAQAALAKDDEQRADLKTVATSRGAEESTADQDALKSLTTASTTAPPRNPEADGASAPAKPVPDEAKASAEKMAPVAQAPAAAPAAIAATTAPVAAPSTPASLPTKSTGGAMGGEDATTISAPVGSTTIVNGPAPSSNLDSRLANNNGGLRFAKVQRQVVPQQMLTRDTASISNTVPEDSDFRRVIGAETSGELARFLENKMRLLVWSHPSADAPIVFGAQLDEAKLLEALKASFQIPELAPSSVTDSNYCVAILDDTGRPVAQSRPGFAADWKHPFVATEIGEVLPHWEAALYLVDPLQISHAARTLQLTLGLIILLLVAAIVAGGSLIGADVRRQVRLAQQKTDFVSNVSHELKTPLTSIRMFADLLAEKRVPDEERQATYLRIIAAEASRLTRLINNVLDFARLEKGAPHGEHAACDLVEAVRDVAETCGPHLEAAGVSFQCEIEAEALPIRGDRDALAQIILNLISNAEKYGGSDVLVRVRRQETSSGALGCVDVLDRGAGIPTRQVRTVFEPFHRLDDSLSSGIPGSGLGLTLARRMARAHGGDVTYSARAGGGSCFTLAVPLAGGGG